jgi:UDP-N-acetylglucosamine transferase subunit ALG13
VEVAQGALPKGHLRRAFAVIFVTVGNVNRGFQRLLDAVDALARDGFFGDEPVFIQSGQNPAFHTEHCSYKAFLPMDEFQERLEKSHLIICHGGSTVLSAVRLGKVPVVMPRRKAYAEHINDHQVQFVQALACEGWIVPASEPEDLPKAISRAREHAQAIPLPKSRMIELVAQAVDELGAEKA